MMEFKRAVSTGQKIKVIRAIESGIRRQIIADTIGKVLEIRARTYADIKAVAAFFVN